jgi:hypothetical protein
MTIRIAALTHLAFPLVALLAVSGACGSIGGTPEMGNARGGSGGRTGDGRGGASGGTSAAGHGGEAGRQPGSGGLAQGGSGGRQGGAGGTGAAPGGTVGSGGRDAGAGGAGGQGGKGGQGGGSAKDAGPRDASGRDAQPVACNDIESAGRLAVYSYDNSEVSGSSIQLYLDIVNFTAFTSRMQQVTLRYWFTDEGAPAANVLEKYYVPIPTTMKFVTLNPPRTGADTVLEVSFADAPDAGVSWVETRGFNFAFHKSSYTGTYDQSNDYSYDPKLKTAFGQNPKITAYVNGVLAWGCEPPIQTVEVDGGASTDDASIGGTDGAATGREAGGTGREAGGRG